ncbi:hypothetical protein Tco_0438647 [Tanacetum coccineum]
MRRPSATGRLYACPIATLPNEMKTVNDVGLYRYLNRRYGELQHTVNDVLAGVLEAGLYRYLNRRYGELQHYYMIIDGAEAEYKMLPGRPINGITILQRLSDCICWRKNYTTTFVQALSMQKIKVPPHPISPMGDAYKMESTAIHQILVMTHYNDDDGTNETIKLDDEQYLGVAICTLSQVLSLYPLDVSIASS